LVKGDKVREGMWLRQTSFYEGKGNASMSFFSGKVPFQRLNSNALKDRLNVVLMREESGGARMRFASWLPDWFYKQMCAEERVAGRGWEPPKGSLRNEAFDLSYYCLAMCVHPDINLDRIKWDEPDKVPGWAREWDKNDFLVLPDKRRSFVETAPKVDLKQAASNFL
jgi:phage terminase large subunit GpA-like protein